PGTPALGVARPKSGSDGLLDQSGLAVGRGAEAAQMPRRDSELRQPAARERNLGIELAVALLPPVRARREQSEVLELAREPCVDACALAELVEVELVFFVRQDGRRATSMASPHVAGAAALVLD